MVLLLLSELNHGCPFPSDAGDNQACLLASFTRRFRAAVAKDAELRVWLEVKSMNCPLAPGLPSSHHARWSVRVCPPSGGMAVGWYRVFAERWKAYLLSQAVPTAAPQLEATRATAAVPPVAAATPTLAVAEGPARRSRSASPPSVGEAPANGPTGAPSVPRGASY